MSIKRPKILVTGHTGLVGSRFVDLYKGSYELLTAGRHQADIYLDLLSESQIQEVIAESGTDLVLNFAAYTNVNEAENEKGNSNGICWTLNAQAPYWLAQACGKFNKKFYHISTDYVFNGQQDKRPYKEKDKTDAVNSEYALSKEEGERNVIKGFNGVEDYCIIRISFPYSGVYRNKLDIARALITTLQNGKTYAGIVDQKIKPTSTDEIAKAIDLLISKCATGIYHVAGDYSEEKYTTPYEFAMRLAKTMSLDVSLIKPISFAKFSSSRVPRPQHTWLDTTKIKQLGMQFLRVDQSMELFKKQMLSTY